MRLFVTDGEIQKLVDEGISKHWQDEVFRAKHQALVKQQEEVETACVHDFKILHEKGDAGYIADRGTQGQHVIHKPFERDYLFCVKCGKKVIP